MTGSRETSISKEKSICERPSRRGGLFAAEMILKDDLINPGKIFSKIFNSYLDNRNKRWYYVLVKKS
jgi:hypothetical protein